MRVAGLAGDDVIPADMCSPTKVCQSWGRGVAVQGGVLSRSYAHSYVRLGLPGCDCQGMIEV